MPDESLRKSLENMNRSELQTVIASRDERIRALEAATRKYHELYTTRLEQIARLHNDLEELKDAVKGAGARPGE